MTPSNSVTYVQMITLWNRTREHDPAPVWFPAQPATIAQILVEHPAFT